jgi:hypothetical protein
MNPHHFRTWVSAMVVEILIIISSNFFSLFIVLLGLKACLHALDAQFLLENRRRLIMNYVKELSIYHFVLSILLDLWFFFLFWSMTVTLGCLSKSLVLIKWGCKIKPSSYDGTKHVVHRRDEVLRLLDI